MKAIMPAHKGIYASMAGRYKLGVQISWHQYFSISISAASHLHKYLTVVRNKNAEDYESNHNCDDLVGANKDGFLPK